MLRGQQFCAVPGNLVSDTTAEHVWMVAHPHKRRKMVKGTARLIVATGAALVGAALIDSLGHAAFAQSPYMTKWLDALPIPPVATAHNNPAYPGADFYQITETQHQHWFHSELGPATVRTYGELGSAGVLSDAASDRGRRICILGGDGGYVDVRLHPA